MLKRSNFNLIFFIKLFLTVLLYELVIGGSGHYLELGPITVRMLLYGGAILISLIYYSYKKVIKKDVFIIILSLSLISIFSSIVGYVNNASIGSILEDFKPLSFFYVLMFFSLFIKNFQDIDNIIVIIKRGSMILALVYLLIIILLLFGKIDFLTFYAQQSEIGEVMFRNETLFFYKGFLYLCVGFFFFLLSKGKYNFLGALFLFTCVMLTLTRGFILFIILISLYYIFFINKKVMLKWGVFLIGIVFMTILIPIIFEALGDKSTSDNERYIQVEQVIDNVNPISFFIGHGFGVGVHHRPVHMEISFLEIFHKQGIIGICFWIGLFLHIFIMYFNIKIKMYKEIALPFLLSVIFVVLQSFTNPFMNNPIGLTIILLTIVVFSKFLEFQNKLNI